MLEESGMHEREGERPRCDDAAEARFLAALFVEVKPVELIQAAAIVLNLFSSHYSRGRFEQNRADQLLKFILSLQSSFHGFAVAPVGVNGFSDFA